MRTNDLNTHDITALIIEARGLRAEATGDLIRAGWTAIKRGIHNALHKNTTALAQQKLATH